ncbi:peptide-methionine (R)-S-oxide reductase MsrB [Haloplanus natans]|uniref:peptide-methionine (R)-S-oxide reductase MsrB n=1 Tax=Haloplanus natans TaxID=376171 RepID=UPI0006779284|nr:peptide-methionine (R)-S-oxide reductase MsrB [Haloplanus natans]
MSEHDRSLADLSDDEWRDRLTEEEYRILRERGTEPKFSGDFLDRKGNGTYTCAGCGAELFDSDTKFDSGSGWPSFYDAVGRSPTSNRTGSGDAVDGAVELETDTRHGMTRTEVLCATCGGHLGHVFEDGPDPTGKRYCINSVALDFDPE